MTLGPIGFEGNRVWEGPVWLDLNLHSEHTRTVRYVGGLIIRDFSVYIPLFIIHDLSGGNIPEKVRVLLQATNELPGVKFFRSQVVAQGEIKHRVVYQTFQEKVNSIRYRLTVDGIEYTLYLPLEILDGARPPVRVSLGITLIDSA